MNPAEPIEKALREHLRIHPQERATAALKAGGPIPLSGGEAAYASQIAVEALAGAGMIVVSVEALRTVARVAAHYLQFMDTDPDEREALRRVLAALPERAPDA